MVINELIDIMYFFISLSINNIFNFSKFKRSFFLILVVLNQKKKKKSK